MSVSPSNVVLIVLDSVRRDHVSCYGYERTTTPNIDRLAQDGVLFQQAYSTSCWTVPAHASLFTGLYPSKHGADLQTKLEDRHQTLAGYLGAHGYRTAAISCNGLVSSNLNRGFEVSLDVNALRGGAHGLPRRLTRAIHRRWRDRTARDRGAVRATKLASRWLGKQEKNKPFFLFLNYMECHLPYRLRGVERHRFVDPQRRGQADAVPQDPFGVMAGAVTLPPEALDHLKALYDGALHYMDRQVGALVERLKELELYQNTLVMVTSDHGESFGEHGLLDHQYGLYEHLIAVPLIMRMPGGERGGETHRSPVQHVDVLPTLAGWLGSSSGNGESGRWQGRSMFEKPPRETVVAEYLVPNLRTIRRRFPEADTSRFEAALRSIRMGRNKLILRSDGQRELYDLVADPGETINLAASQPDLADVLQERLHLVVGDEPAASPGQPQRGLDAVADRLRALGYL